MDNHLKEWQENKKNRFFFTPKIERSLQNDTGETCGFAEATMPRNDLLVKKISLLSR